MKRDRQQNILALFYDIGRASDDELKELENAGQIPRATFFPAVLNADILDRRMLKQAPPIRRAIFRLLPVEVSQVIEALIVHAHYDLVLSWNERLGFVFAFLCRILKTKPVPHVAMCTWPTKGIKALLLRLGQSRISRLILWSSVQRALVVEKLGITPAKIAFLHYFVDEKFFRPVRKESDMICSVGSEMRDFPTFLEAIRETGIPCHIAAGTLHPKRTRWVKAIDTTGALPSNVTVGRKSPFELRELYARSRFVVIPLMESDTDNGITCILEAFAMGKPVICSRTRGQVDVIENGKTGIFVPVGDAIAMREAILDLWNDADTVQRMGKAARAYVEQYQTLEKFTNDVRNVVDQVLSNSHRPGSMKGIDRQHASAVSA